MIEVETFIMNDNDYCKKNSFMRCRKHNLKIPFVRESPTEDEESSQKTIAEVLKQKLIIHNQFNIRP
jgi:hypothetical protein